MLFSNKVYDVLKWIAQIFLPAFATLYFALSPIWNFPHTDAVVGTIVALNVLLGALLGLSEVKYNEEKRLSSIYNTGENSEDPYANASLVDETEAAANMTYEVMKWVTRILLPAAGTFYLTISVLWLLPYGSEVVNTVAAVTAFLGVLLGLSTAKYHRNSEA